MNKVIIILLVLFSLLLSACGQTAATPEVVEPKQPPAQATEAVVQPTHTPEVVTEPTAAATQTQEPTLEPSPTPTEEPPPPGSNAPSEEELADTIRIGELLAPDEGSLKVFTDENILQFAIEVRGSILFMELLDEGPFTVFAPAYVFEDITTTFAPGQFSHALRSHIVLGWYFEEDLIAMDGQSIPTLADGVAIQITVKDGVVYINDVAMIRQADILARNGVIHVIDQFLLPAAE